MNPHEYLSSTYENRYEPKNKLDLSKYYDITDEPPMTSTPRPWKWTTVEPWTSLDKAKPDWDQVNPEGQQSPQGSTYGSWNQDTLKISAVPFSRSTDGKERKWVKVSSVKRKRVPVGKQKIVLDENIGLKIN